MFLLSSFCSLRVIRCVAPLYVFPCCTNKGRLACAAYANAFSTGSNCFSVTLARYASCIFLLCVSFQFFLNGISSKLSQPITSAAVPQKKAASASLISSSVTCFSSTGISCAAQISSTVARVMPGRIFPAMVYRVCHLFHKTYSHPHLLRQNRSCRSAALHRILLLLLPGLPG